MSLTAIALEGVFYNPDGSYARGTITARPNSMLRNDGIEIPQAPVSGVLNSLGQVVAQTQWALDIWATDDTDTEPEGSNYTFTIDLDGAPINEFSAIVPKASTATETNGATVDLSPTITFSTLVVSASMVGKPITGTNIPGSTTVLSVNPATNQATLSNEATGTSPTGCSFVVGGAVQLSALQANAL